MGAGTRYTELIDFYEEYAAFLAQVLRDEEEKLQALLSNSLPRIEHAISAAQANAKQMENLELRREMLQERAGCGGKTFREILELVPQEEQAAFQSLFERIQKAVELIKFHNEKSMSVARANVKAVNPEALMPGEQKNAAMENPYMRARRQAQPEHSTSLLETKI